MTVFVDSSALVKRYVREAGAAVLDGLPLPFVVSGVTRVEVSSAIWRLQRGGWLTDAEAATSMRSFDADWMTPGPPVVVPVALTPALLDVATRLVARHPLRSLDAVQLASALAARELLDPAMRFLTFDARLRVAALVEGFGVVSVA